MAARIIGSEGISPRFIRSSDVQTVIVQETPKPNRRLRRAGTLAAMAVGAILVATHGHAFAAGTAGNTIGGRVQAGSADLQTGGSYALEMFCYIFAGMCGIAGGYTFWQNHKNPNGQHKLGYAVASVVATGFFATMPSIVNFSSQTVSAQNATMNAASTQLTYGNG
jgi:hypothetical protein